MKQRIYIAIDLKSFYASVECRERGLDPLDTNLVVADESRTDKTICLAVTPSLKNYGISGRGRLFEVKQRVKEANAGRQHDAPGHRLDGSSHFFSELQADPSLAIDFIIAPPQMAYYMEYSTRIYQIYLKYIAPEDIVVYSIDEVFMDVTDYRLKLAFDFDSKQLAKVISAIADCGAQPELSIAFTVKNPARVSEELLISATENAKTKAEILCKASGNALGQLLNIDYNWGELNVYSRTSYEVEDCIQPLMAMSKCAAPEIEPDDIDVTDTVAFTWEIQ